MTPATGGEDSGVLAAADRRAGRLGTGAYAFCLCTVVLVACGLIGLLVHQPFLFPSLGPTVMLFFENPHQTSASPRSTVIGHAVAIAVGAGCLALFGLTDHPAVTQEGLSAARIGAAALSVAATALLLKLLGASHPPAGATTLIISLGILTSAGQLLTMALAVLLVTVLGVGANRLLGVRAPLWR